MNKLEPTIKIGRQNTLDRPAKGKNKPAAGKPSSPKNIDQVNLAHGLLISGNLYAVDVTGTHADGDLTFTAETLQTVSAAIDSTGNDSDVILQADAIVTFKAALGKDSDGNPDIIDILTLGATSTTIFESTVNATTAAIADAATRTASRFCTSPIAKIAE